MSGGEARGDGGAPLADLVAVVGAEHVARGGDDDAIRGVAPRWIARPASREEAARVVRLAAERGLVVAPIGGGAHSDLGAAPAEVDVALSLARLDGVIEHSAADMTVTVAAGCTLAALDATLAAAGQWLPLDPPRAAGTTIGGLIAANLSGPLRASQGTVRDLLLGIEVIGAGGERIRGGGKVVKNVAGYDLPKLHVGALGSLGAIVEATFKVRPRPACEQAVAIRCAKPLEAGELALRVRDAIEPAWLEIASGGNLAAAPRLTTLAGVDEAEALLIAGVCGVAAEVEDAVARLVRLATAEGQVPHVVPDGAALRAELAARMAPAGAIVLKAATPPSQVGEATRLLQSAADRSATVALLAHAASGVTRSVECDPDSNRGADETVFRLRPVFEAMGGSLVVERAPARLGPHDAGLVWGTPPAAVELMRGVKRALDPAGTFVAGRLPGGV